uniref:glycosyltransferase n=1 Tax=Orrella sp. TaxID=1921583 RepID=UPI0040480173
MLKTRPNILFVSPQKLDSNTGYHIQWYAKALAEHGAKCVIVVPQQTSAMPITADGLTIVGYEQVINDGTVNAFRNGRSVDVLYAWTPRERVRRFSQSVMDSTGCRLLIHFEDNEEYLTECSIGMSLTELLHLSDVELNKAVPIDRYHPRRGKQFIEQADGLSYLIDTLKRFNTRGVPDQVIRAPVDESLFFQRPINYGYRRKLGIDDSDYVLVYAGNVHDANLKEVTDLYEAVSLLNQKGISTTLIRTGTNDQKAQVKLDSYSAVFNLGWVDRQEMPDVLSCADIFVQPGSPGPFNDERVPSKLPEFFAIGRPVILPFSNLGLMVEDGKDALIIKDVSPVGIAASVERVFKSKALLKQLTIGSRQFYESALKADIGTVVSLLNDALLQKRLASLVGTLT